MLLEHLDTLRSCHEEIGSACSMAMTENATTRVQYCGLSASSLSDEIENCIKPSISATQSCECFAALNTTNLDRVQNCNITEESNYVKTIKNDCTNGRKLINLITVNIKLGRVCRIPEM